MWLFYLVVTIRADRKAHNMDTQYNRLHWNNICFESVFWNIVDFSSHQTDSIPTLQVTESRQLKSCQTGQSVYKPVVLKKSNAMVNVSLKCSSATIFKTF